jgi:polyisoprenoid-binding protein YceI
VLRTAIILHKTFAANKSNHMEKQTSWVLDPAHSEVTFKVKHLMIANVKGEFRKFDVNVQVNNENFSSASISARIDITSIDTNNTDRDNHLKSADFFDAEKFPAIEFVSSSFSQLDEENAKLTGNLTIKGVTKEVVLEIETGGISKDPWGQTKAGFTVNGKINRTDFGLTWNAALETGGVLVSEEVKIQAEIQLLKKTDA